MNREVKKILIKILKVSGPVLVEVGSDLFINLVKYGADKIGSITFNKDKQEIIVEPFDDVIEVDEYEKYTEIDIDNKMSVVGAVNQFEERFVDEESNVIKYFRGNNFFLSNYYISSVNYKGIEYSTAEAAFQSMKTKDLNERKKFSTLTPKEARRLGRKLELREDWEEVKEEIMYKICLCKFEQNEYLADRLRKTGDAYLQQETTWNDREWGIVNGEGENKLGKILMRVREEINREI